MITDLHELARSLTTGAEPFAFCGIAVSTGQDRFYVSSHLDVTPHTYWRAASISKIVVGRVAQALFAEGGQAVEDVLGYAVRPPVGAPPTIAQLASHQSGLCDDAGYSVPTGTGLSTWLAAKGPDIWSGSPPGERLIYTNLGYLILAACCEKKTGRTLADLAQEIVFDRLGVNAGFNWVGFDPLGLSVPTFRRAPNGVFQAQIDASQMPADLRTYRIAEDTAALSPQGGLRINLKGALDLAKGLADHPADTLWHNTAPTDPLFQHYGWGVQIFDEPAFYPRPLIGHFGNAYGFCGGVWHDLETQISFSYALNGLAEGDSADALRPAERAILNAVSQAA